MTFFQVQQTLDQLGMWQKRINVGYNKRCDLGQTTQAVNGGEKSTFEVLMNVAGSRSMGEHQDFCSRHGLGQAFKVLSVENGAISHALSGMTVLLLALFL